MEFPALEWERLEVWVSDHEIGGLLLSLPVKSFLAAGKPISQPLMHIPAYHRHIHYPLQVLYTEVTPSAHQPEARSSDPNSEP